jgi:hypothetical protein
MVKDYEEALQNIIATHAAKKGSSPFGSKKIAKSIKGLSKRLIRKPSKIVLKKKK